MITCFNPASGISQTWRIGACVCVCGNVSAVVYTGGELCNFLSLTGCCCSRFGIQGRALIRVVSGFAALITVSGTGAVRRTPTLSSATIARVLPFPSVSASHFLTPSSFRCKYIGLVGWGRARRFLWRDLGHLEVRIL